MSSNQVLPSFFLPGVGKSGTSSLYEYLREHPDIFMPDNKEPGFFNWDGEEHRYSGPVDEELRVGAVRDWQEYLELFKPGAGAKHCGEATPNYVYNPKVPARIHARIPDAKMVIILRNPAERVFSHFLHMQRMEDEVQDLHGALTAEARRRRANWGPSYHYVEQGFYHRQLTQWFEVFPKEQIGIWLFDEFKVDALSVTQQIYRFLEVEDSFVPDTSVKHNAHYAPKNRAMQNLVMKKNPVKTLAKAIVPEQVRKQFSSYILSQNKAEKPRLCPQQRNQLIDLYQPDIEQLQDLIQRDLIGWMLKR